MFPLQDIGCSAAPREHAADAGLRPAAGAAFGIFVPRGIVIRHEQMLKIMGYPSGAPIRTAVRRMAERTAELAAAAMMPVVHHCRVAIERCDAEGLALANGIAFHGPVFAKHLTGCSEAMAFVMTLGSRFDTTQRNLSESDNLLDAVFLETAGWVAIEEATRLFTQQARQAALRQGLELSRRLAPGYVFRVGDRKVDWPLEDQKPFFKLFEGIDLPVELLESCAMMPKMSRTGLFGLRRCAEPNQNA
ncbi:MAG: hypothetical protein AB7V13_01720 [Pseudorhodoplanes sp.]|uniref:hypothetical protein n=1 Tax=Pseudorhodoplanes sp. TaxID=1934341 RepID=UPI003D0CC416